VHLEAEPVSGGDRLGRDERHVAERGRHLEGDAGRTVAGEPAVAQAEDPLGHLGGREAGQHVGRGGAHAGHDRAVLGGEQRLVAGREAIEHGDQRGLRRGIGLLQLDVERDAREGREDLRQRRHAEPAAAERIRPVGGAEAVARVEVLEGGEGKGADEARAVRRALQGLVVDHDHLPVGGGVHVQLEPFCPPTDAGGKGVEGVLGKQAGGAAVGEEARARAVQVARRATPGRGLGARA